MRALQSAQLCAAFAVTVLTATPRVCSAGVSENLLKNPGFEAGPDASSLPPGWSLYGGGGVDQQIRIVDPESAEQRAVLLQDGDQNAEIGLRQTLPIQAELHYEASVEIRGLPGSSSHGAYLQLRFSPSNEYTQRSLVTWSHEKFKRVAIRATAPPDTKQATVYLYTHSAPTPKLLLRAPRLVSGVDPPPPPVSQLVPPVYGKLKNLHLDTTLVAAGKPSVTIITGHDGLYGDDASRIQKAIAERTGVTAPIAADDSPASAVPITGNLIVLGNRSTNRCIGTLYDRFYTLLDLRYPGPEGYVVRTLHDPFGDGHNVIFVGGSDATGVQHATDGLMAQLAKADVSAGGLSVGRLAEIRLGKGVSVPTDIRKFGIWEASRGYRSTGYFGWNSISKRMAMYYMTGEELHAKEFLRLAFPDEKAKQEIADIDGERIENKDTPLSGPYHYNAHMMILFWDLIEESPVFTDADRLRVTNAFAKQLDHRKGERVYALTMPPRAVGTRHGQWSAISLYCLARYFQKDYPNPIWEQCIRGAKLAFAPLHEHAWVSGENDNLFWYNTAISPIFTYLALTGDREPLDNGVLATLLRGQEILVTGRQPDWALNSASIGFLHKAAHITQDGRYVHYRKRTGVDMGTFRLGQSFWPEPHLTPEPPADLVGKWTIYRPPEPMWAARGSGLAFDESFLFGSYRSASDGSGDFILIDGFNGASRNPYHTFAILELRLGGHTLLKGYRNQLTTRLDGLVEPRVAMDAALTHHDVIGATAIATAEVPNAAYSRWRRTLVQRTGRYGLVVDDLAFRAGGDNMEVQIHWETEGAPKVLSDGHIEFVAVTETPTRRSVPGGRIRSCDPLPTTRRGHVATMQWVGPVQERGQRWFFSLLGVEPKPEQPALDCIRIADNAAALALPKAGLAFAGTFRCSAAEVAVLAADHVFARAFTKLEVPTHDEASDAGTATLALADAATDLDWDFESGSLHIVAADNASLRLALVPHDALRLDGALLTTRVAADGLVELKLAGGRHRIEGAKPIPAVRQEIASSLDSILAGARKARAAQAATAHAEADSKVRSLTAATSAKVGGAIVDLITVPSTAGDRIYAAEGSTVHVLTRDGKTLHKLETDGPVRMVRWWAEHDLLLAGCADEQVIAFDADGKRKWAFTSEMDPAVLRAAKTYWFKSAPGHEGIHGLDTGVFLDGKSQAFVGSACTLEILDENGKLIKRMVQFWGKVSHFAIVDGPKGTLNLLASRKYNGTNTVAIINNKTLSPSPRGFYSVPSGSTHIGGWSSLNRHHLFYEDLDGDGAKEVISEINGTWNRVTVWSGDGKALHDASFGPGERIPVKNMRDLDIADLDGDGKKEILAATSAGLVVALDHQCKKRWARRLASPPVVMQCVAPASGGNPRTVVGCEDGTVVLLNGRGAPIGAGKVSGRPSCITALSDTATGAAVLLATDAGEVKAFAVDP